MRSLRILTIVLLLLAAARAVPAQEGWRLQPLLRVGERVGDVALAAPGYFRVGALNDAGQLLVVAKAAAGDVLLYLGEAGPATLVAAGQAAPGGTWNALVSPRSPASLNREGNAVFAAEAGDGPGALGTYRWERATGQSVAVALRGMPAGSNLLERGGGTAPVINNRDEIALVAGVRDAAGRLADGVFLAARDGSLATVAAPDAALPDGKVALAFAPSINDTGAVAFMAYRQGESQRSPSAYLWEGGTTRLVLAPGMTAPGNLPVYHVQSVRLNNHHPGALVLAHASDDHSHHDPRLPHPPLSLYLWTDGVLTPIALIDQKMPGGGRLWTIEPDGVSPMNSAGEIAFLARLPQEQTALYLRRADGTVALLLKTGTKTAVGRVTSVGRATGSSSGIALNNKGQIAVTLKIGKEPDTLYLLSPATP